MEPSDLEVLPASMAAGTSRVFARRHLLPYKHPAIAEPGDFLASLRAAFGPPPPEDPTGYVFWHAESGTHFTAYVHDGCAAYGGGVKLGARPDAETLRAAYADENARRAANAASLSSSPGGPPNAAAASAGGGAPDPFVADLAGSASSFNEHMREVERAQLAAPRGAYELLMRFEKLLERFPPADRRTITAHGLDTPDEPGAVSLLARGVEDGKYFERQVTIDEAFQLVSDKLGDDAERVAKVLFDWWAPRAKVAKPPDAAAALLLTSWRGRFDAAMREVAPPASGAVYQENAQARHADYERAQRWMRFARLGLLLPLTLADADALAEAANPLAMQSAEHKKLEKLRKTLRAAV